MKTYTIKELSKQYNLQSSTLRYYEDIGLLCNVVHDSRNQRVYTQEHIDRLNAIQCFKQTGLSLNGMLLFFSYEKNLAENIDEIVELMSGHEDEIVSKINELEAGLAHIRNKVRYYEAIKKSIANGTKWPCWDEIECCDSIKIHNCSKP